MENISSFKTALEKLIRGLFFNNRDFRAANRVLTKLQL